MTAKNPKQFRNDKGRSTRSSDTSKEKMENMASTPETKKRSPWLDINTMRGRVVAGAVGAVLGAILIAGGKAAYHEVDEHLSWRIEQTAERHSIVITWED
ncbi:hypothetical protein [Nocardia xishanensis]